jgi:hypothetical protein
MLLASLTITASAQGLPDGYAPVTVTQPIIDKTLQVNLAPDVSGLTAAESTVVDLLIQTGKIFQPLYENMKHFQATESHIYLEDIDRNTGRYPATQNLLKLYYANSGPIIRGLDNKRHAYLPVDPPVPGGNVYPWGVTKDEVNAFLKAHPEETASILHPRTVVRRCEPELLRADLEALNRHKELRKLFPKLEAKLLALSRKPDSKAFYAVPYPVAYSDEMFKASKLLAEAADSIATTDRDFSGYLRARSNDLITNNYMPGDSAWVTGQFKNLNAQIGAYETYDDALFGVKTFFSLNVVLRDNARSEALGKATAQLQSLEDSLPYNPGEKHKQVRTDLPVGFYNVLADFAQSRGTNTATILPNDAEAARKFGRTILLRENIMMNEELFVNQQSAYQAVMAPAYVNDLVAQGNLNRTLWHELGHYLGVDATRDGRDLDQALGQAADIFEEMKADLVALFLIPALQKMNYYDDASARAVRASGVRRVLLKNQPERAQVYGTMELMQFNYFMSKGALSFDAKTGKLSVDYAKQNDAAGAMLSEVLEIQAAGDPTAAEAYITQWTEWKDDVHGKLAETQRAAEQYRFAFVTYSILAE